ncbi:MAG: HAD family phosphatase [Acetobacter sp.]|nr:HAD family phosphatase [Acetobacter sp.]
MTEAALSAGGLLKLVIFDCDGVLIDSEGLSCRILAAEARKLGLDIPDDRAVEAFAGKAVPLIRKELEEASGQSLDPDWSQRMQEAFVASFRHGVETMPGASDMLDGVIALSLPIRVGSNSSCAEMEAKFQVTALETRLPSDRIHSAKDMNVPKPAPDVYLHAAAMENVRPEQCVVLEDSDPGARAAILAGMTCVLLRPFSKEVPNWLRAQKERFVQIESLEAFVPILSRALTAQKGK